MVVQMSVFEGKDVGIPREPLCEFLSDGDGVHFEGCRLGGNGVLIVGWNQEAERNLFSNEGAQLREVFWCWLWCCCDV